MGPVCVVVGRCVTLGIGDDPASAEETVVDSGGYVGVVLLFFKYLFLVNFCYNNIT